MVEAWEALLAGDTDDAEARFDAAKEICARRGFIYMPANMVAKQPLADVLQNVPAQISKGFSIAAIEADVFQRAERLQ